jgi:hypothetical protein
LFLLETLREGRGNTKFERDGRENVKTKPSRSVPKRLF